MEYDTNLSLSTWQDDDKPREKLLKHGARHLSNVELLAILLGNGTRGLNVVELARRILQSVDNNLSDLGRLGINDICRFKGIGKAKAMTIAATMELGRRRQLSKFREKPVVKSSSDAYQYISPSLKDLNREEFWVLFLNRANHILAFHKMSEGGLVGTVVDVRIIFSKALQLQSTSIILTHNHPSGQCRPSSADIQITKKMIEAGKFLDIKVFDHLIIAGDGYYSFADEGNMF